MLSQLSAIILKQKVLYVARENLFLRDACFIFNKVCFWSVKGKLFFRMYKLLSAA